jgi:O-antigen biosynthesis protein
LECPPLFSIISFLAPDEAALGGRASIESVLGQLYPHWELWLPVGSTAANWATDSRLRVARVAPANNHTALFNAALTTAAGEFVVPLPPDAMLAETALYELAVAALASPEIDLLYTDEDRINAAGERCAPHFKTGWDPDLALGRDAIGLLVAYRKTLLDKLGGMRRCVSGASVALYDLSLRAAFEISPEHIQHVPAILCHRRDDAEAPFEWDTEGARDIVRRHLTERGVRAHVLPAPLAPCWNRIMREVTDPAPLVSVILPTRDRADLLERSTDALLRRTEYPALEVIIVDNDSNEPATSHLFQRLSQDSRVQLLSHPGPFNYAAMNNRAAQEARGEILLLLNNDTDVIDPDWLREMVSHAMRPDVGAVGAKLLYEDERVQHAGMVLGPGSALEHQLRFSASWDSGPGGELALTRTVSAVTGACLAMRRSVFSEVGGLDERWRVAFNDIDMCLRIGDHGYRIVWTPFAELFHLESASRGYDDTPEKQALATNELRQFCLFWRSLLDADPFHNPNVIYTWDGQFALATPPRRKRPWYCSDTGTVLNGRSFS